MYIYTSTMFVYNFLTVSKIWLGHNSDYDCDIKSSS